LTPSKTVLRVVSRTGRLGMAFHPDQPRAG
jgi:hypothetical protein